VTQAFWKTKTLQQMTTEEWESLCDHCGKCCLIKLEDEDTGDLYFTNIVCRLMDMNNCHCREYQRRATLVQDCVDLKNIPNLGDLPFLPASCAYRLISENQELPQWHPLVSGDPESVFKAGHSVRGRVFSEFDNLELEDHIVEWPMQGP